MQTTVGKNTSVGNIFLGMTGLILLLGSIYAYLEKSNMMLAGICFLAAVIIPLAFWSNHLSSVPVITINDEGICDLRLGVGTIRWEDIESAQVEANYGNRYICLRVRSADRYISNLPDQKRKKVEDSRSLGFTLFNVDVQGLRISLLDLLKHIEKKIN